MLDEDFLKWKGDILHPTRPIFSKICPKFNTFRLADKYADVTIKCENRLFKCHRIVLAAVSDYFDTAFFDNASEEDSPPTKKRKSEGVLHEIFDLKELVIKADIFEDIIQFVYTGSLKITTSDHWREFLRASESIKLSCVEELCIEHLTKHGMSVKSILEVLKFPFVTKKDALQGEFCDQIAKELRIFWTHDMFPQIPFKHFSLILKKVPGHPPTVYNSDDVTLNCIIRWVLHDRVERLPHLDELIKSRWEKVPPATISAVSELVQQASSLTFTGTITKGKISSRAVSYRRQNSFSRRELAPKALLYVYIKAKGDTSMKVFSIHRENNRDGTRDICRAVGGIQGWQITNHHNPWIRSVVVDDLRNGTRLYNLYYGRRSSAQDKAIQNQSFDYCTAELDSAVALSPPPVIFDDVKLCAAGDNIIYAYNQFLSRLRHPLSVRVWNSTRECKEIYKYQCYLDRWFLVPAMEESVMDACMAIHEDTLYLIGGRDLMGNVNRFVKAYDTRARKWQNLTYSGRRWFLGTDCCALNDRIYVTGGTDNNQMPVVAAYDIKANKWAMDTPLNARLQYHRMVPYTDDEIWAMGSFENGNLYDNNLSITVINTKMDSRQTNSSILVDPVNRSSLVGKGKSFILDAVSFKDSLSRGISHFECANLII